MLFYIIQLFSEMLELSELQANKFWSLVLIFLLDVELINAVNKENNEGMLELQNKGKEK